jgi:tetratricopeptide (TPR) repeat protein
VTIYLRQIMRWTSLNGEKRASDSPDAAGLCRQAHPSTYPAIITALAVLQLLFAAGCARQQRAVELYVDAVMLKELNENEKAITKLNQAVKANKRFSLAHSLLGEIYEQMQDYHKSVEAYETATQLNPWSFKDYFSLGRVYQTMKEFALAVKAYRRACELKPNHLEANISAAKCLYEIKDYDQALIYGSRAAQIAPNIVELHQLLGNISDSQKDYEQAVRSYKRALEIDSSNPQTMMLLAVAYLRTGRNEPAKELLTTITQIQPHNSAGWQYLGYCFLRLDEGDRAIESYRKAIEVNDRDWEAYRGLGVAYMLKAIKNEDVLLKSQAVELWRQSLSIRPDQPRRDRLIKLIEKYSR